MKGEGEKIFFPSPRAPLPGRLRLPSLREPPHQRQGKESAANEDRLGAAAPKPPGGLRPPRAGARAPSLLPSKTERRPSSRYCKFFAFLEAIPRFFRRKRAETETETRAFPRSAFGQRVRKTEQKRTLFSFFLFRGKPLAQFLGGQMNNRIAIYCRVSTDTQTNDSQNAELAAYVEKQGWTNPRVFIDTISGAVASRPALDKLVGLCRAGAIDKIVCVKLDRLGRSLIHLAGLLSEFKRLRVALICISQGIDTSEDNPAAHFQVQVLAAVAEFERTLIVERVKAGLRHAKSRGKRLGREPLAEILRPRARQLRMAGQSMRQIARALHVSVGSAFKLSRYGPIEKQEAASLRGAAKPEKSDA